VTDEWSGQPIHRSQIPEIEYSRTPLKRLVSRENFLVLMEVMMGHPLEFSGPAANFIQFRAIRTLLYYK